MSVVDLFAGPGGWSEALKQLGLSETGIEYDPDACATARAAGHVRLQEDVAASFLHVVDVLFLTVVVACAVFSLGDPD